MLQQYPKRISTNITTNTNQQRFKHCLVYMNLIKHILIDLLIMEQRTIDIQSMAFIKYTVYGDST